ncbi:MAG: exonuclease domain-containing protein [Pseudomonadota bacterium]
MSRYLSLDTEATGLEVDCYLIQVALVPIDGTSKTILTEWGKEVLIQCPSFEELKPKLNPWVLEHNEDLIRKAHRDGISPSDFKKWMENYLLAPEIKTYFKNERPTLLGKSMSALDIPVLTRYLGKEFMEKYFHHHTLDLTCVARFLTDTGKLPTGCYSTSKLLQHFKIRHKAEHTALSDASDMGQVYFKLIELLKSQ